jgi:L-glyceraldehyde 3-phosphate reductase
MAQMALAWILKDERITSVILGASKPIQVVDAIGCLKNYHFSKEEADNVEFILKQ